MWQLNATCCPAGGLETVKGPSRGKKLMKSKWSPRFNKESCLNVCFSVLTDAPCMLTLPPGGNDGVNCTGCTATPLLLRNLPVNSQMRLYLKITHMWLALMVSLCFLRNKFKTFLSSQDLPLFKECWDNPSKRGREMDSKTYKLTICQWTSPLLPVRICFL